MINVTKSVLPKIEEYIHYLRQIWETGHLTNHGPLVAELEEKIRNYSSLEHFYYVNNGTIAIQIAIKALELTGEVLTTPFSYVATTSSLVWENCKPVFVDIDSETLTINADLLEASITERTTGILATHVYGIPCDVEKIEAIAKKHSLKVIYDAAHAFGVRINGRGLLTYGDISTLSFHATKLFHTVEGGGIAVTNAEVAHRVSYMRNFGHNGPEKFFGVGVNGKSSEFHAAMGLCLFDRVPQFIERRRQISELYDLTMAEEGIEHRRPAIADAVEYNYAYYPIILPSEAKLLEIRDRLNAYNIFPRRYFYPTLNELHYVENPGCPVSEDISKRVLCLPLYPDLTDLQVRSIVHKIKE